MGRFYYTIMDCIQTSLLNSCLQIQLQMRRFAFICFMNNLEIFASPKLLSCFTKQDYNITFGFEPLGCVAIYILNQTHHAYCRGREYGSARCLIIKAYVATYYRNTQ